MWICWRQKDGQSRHTMRGAADRYALAVRITESMRCPPGLGEVCSILATSLQSPRTRWAVRGPDLVLVLGRARARGNLGDLTLDVDVSQRRARRYTIFQNAEITLGQDRWVYSECWPLSHKGRAYDVFRVPEGRRDELYTARTYTWVEEEGQTPEGYARGVPGDPDTPWGAAFGRAQPGSRRASERWGKQWYQPFCAT